jgi:hypothetical protein
MSARIATGVSPRTRAMLAWAACLGAVTAESLAAREATTLASARGRLAAAVGAGTMEAWPLLRGHPALHTVTRAGLRAAAADGLAPARVSPGGALHAIACAQAAVSLEAAFPGAAVLGEPAVRRRESALGRPLALVRVPRSPSSVTRAHRPDLLVVEHGGEEAAPLAVEVELTVKAPERLAAICLGWARSREVGGVLYLAAPATAPAVERAIAASSAGERVLVVALDALG